MTSARALRRQLNELARLYGIQRSYEDINGERQHASPEALFLTLRALGAQLASPADAGDALRARRAQLEAEGTEPIHTAWGGRLPRLACRLPPGDGAIPAQLHLRLESGEVRSWPADFQPAGRPVGATQSYRLRIPGTLPFGYHELEIETRGRTHRTRIFSAPRKAHVPAGRCSWGVFAPLYALRGPRDDGAGDLHDLAVFAKWVGDQGGDYVGTLPLLAAFMDRPFEPSPYSPVSRLFWNEFYVAGQGRPPVAPARAAEPLVDYRTVARQRRDSLAAECAAFLAAGAEGEQAELRQFVASRSRLGDYARFRAVSDRLGSGWRGWPERQRDGELQVGDFDPQDEAYYQYAQWQADRQLGSIGEAATAGSAALYLDLPLGVNPDGYDAWRFRELFAEGASAGAPPDTLFTGGQDWGFRPLAPEPLRRTGYGYLIEAIRHHLRHARMLRLDHVMSLYRLFWIPAGLTAREGVYVQYPADEMLAVLLTESARHQAAIVGEDLGTVPRAVRRGMERRQVLRIYVVQYELDPVGEPPLNQVPRNAVASVNTHDMPPFASFLRAGEVADQLDLQLIDDAEAAVARATRAELVQALSRFLENHDHEPRRLLEAVLDHLAASDARSVLLTLEDLWLATEAQNVPGTSTERPNWRRRFDRTLAQIMADPGILATLRGVHERRCAGPDSTPASNPT